MNIIVICIITVILILLLMHSLQNEQFSTMPPLSMGVQWGSIPQNLYRSDYQEQNYFGDVLSKEMRGVDLTNFNFSRGSGAGTLGDISRKLGYTISKISYK